MVVAVTKTSEGPSYLGNDELQLEELDALAREVTSADIASSDGGSSDDMPDSNLRLHGWLLGNRIYRISSNSFRPRSSSRPRIVSAQFASASDLVSALD